jgi:hypothetical protein
LERSLFDAMIGGVRPALAGAGVEAHAEEQSQFRAGLACRRAAEAAALGLKTGTYPTGLLSPATAGIKAGLAALLAGEAEAASAPPPPELRATLGYADYEFQAKRFIVPG